MSVRARYFARFAPVLCTQCVRNGSVEMTLCASTSAFSCLPSAISAAVLIASDCVGRTATIADHNMAAMRVRATNRIVDLSGYPDCPDQQFDRYERKPARGTKAAFSQGRCGDGNPLRKRHRRMLQMPIGAPLQRLGGVENRLFTHRRTDEHHARRHAVQTESGWRGNGWNTDEVARSDERAIRVSRIDLVERHRDRWRDR